MTLPWLFAPIALLTVLFIVGVVAAVLLMGDWTP